MAKPWATNAAGRAGLQHPTLQLSGPAAADDQLRAVVEDDPQPGASFPFHLADLVGAEDGGAVDAEEGMGVGGLLGVGERASDEVAPAGEDGDAGVAAPRFDP